jgi:hypothetical protein
VFQSFANKCLFSTLGLFNNSEHAAGCAKEKMMEREKNGTEEIKDVPSPGKEPWDKSNIVLEVT